MLRIVISLALTTLISGTACAQGISLDSQILWKDEDHTRALFLPEEVLRSTPLEALPLPEHEIADLRGQAQLFQQAKENPGQRNLTSTGCYPEARSANQEPREEGLSIAEAVATTEVAIVGRVADVVPGWDSWRNRVAKAVYIEVNEVLHINDQSGDLKGAVVAFLQEGGMLQIGEHTLCSGEIKGFYKAAVGDLVFVAAERWPEDENFFVQKYVFPMSGETVQWQPYGNLRTGTSELLSEILASLRESE